MRLDTGLPLQIKVIKKKVSLKISQIWVRYAVAVFLQLQRPNVNIEVNNTTAFNLSKETSS